MSREAVLNLLLLPFIIIIIIVIVIITTTIIIIIIIIIVIIDIVIYLYYNDDYNLALFSSKSSLNVCRLWRCILSQEGCWACWQSVSSEATPCPGCASTSPACVRAPLLLCCGSWPLRLRQQCLLAPIECRQRLNCVVFCAVVLCLIQLCCFARLCCGAPSLPCCCIHRVWVLMLGLCHYMVQSVRAVSV